MLRRSLPFLAVISSLIAVLAGGVDVSAENLSPGLLASAESAANRQPVLTSIGVVKSEAGTQIVISGDSDLTYEYFVIEGKSLAIDIPGASSTVWPAEQEVVDEFVSRIQVAAQTGEKPGARVVIALKRPDGFTVRGENGRIVVLFPSRKDSISPNRAPINRVVEVTASRLAGAFRVSVKTDAKPAYRVLESGDRKRITVAVDGARLEPNTRKTSDFSSLDTPVTLISTWAEPADPGVVLVAIDLRQPLPFRVFTDENGVNVDFTVAVAATREPPPSSDLPRLTPGSTLAPLPPEAQPAAPADPAGSPRIYSGRKITLDFIDADLADIFRLIADVSGMNIVATDDVKGKRSVKMNEVPWDQALDLILRTNIPPLVSIGEGTNIIRIMTKRAVDEAASEHAKSLLVKREEYRRQEESIQKMADNRRDDAEKDREFVALNGTMVSRTFKLSYIDKVEDVVRLFQGMASQRVAPDIMVSTGATPEVVKNSRGNSLLRDGYIRADPRTRTILVRDLEPNVNEMVELLAKIDLPTPAVLVEARIVEMSSDSGESLGIQWGANFTADAAHGNATQYAFPNSVGISGTQGQAGNLLVNLPAVAPVAGVGINFGHIANIFSLDMKISAMEKLGKGKLLSSPRIMVVDNKPAYIEFGDSIAVHSIKSSVDPVTLRVTATDLIEFIKIPLRLEVTPRVTNDKTVFMDIFVKNEKRGETIIGFDGNVTTNIVAREAKTSVLVADGETTVIGGIFIESTDNADNSVPGLSRLPLLGWLFKSRNTSGTRKEMIIFLTPRIVHTRSGGIAVTP